MARVLLPSGVWRGFRGSTAASGPSPSRPLSPSFHFPYIVEDDGLKRGSAFDPRFSSSTLHETQRCFGPTAMHATYDQFSAGKNRASRTTRWRIVFPAAANPLRTPPAPRIQPLFILIGFDSASRPSRRRRHGCMAEDAPRPQLTVPGTQLRSRPSLPRLPCSNPKKGLTASRPPVGAPDSTPDSGHSRDQAYDSQLQPPPSFLQQASSWCITCMGRHACNGTSAREPGETVGGGPPRSLNSSERTRAGFMGGPGRD